MEEWQGHYTKEKENLRVDLVATLLSARKMVHQQQMIQQQINEHMRQQQKVQQHQQNFQQLQSTRQRDVQQQQLQQQLNSLMYAPPPGHADGSGQGGVPTTSPQQVPQPVPVRYVYMPTGTQPQFVTINGQQLQVGGGLQGQQLVAVQGGPGQPQQYSSLPPGR